MNIRIAPMLNKLFLSFILIISLFPFKARSNSFIGEHLVYTDVFLLVIFMVLSPLYFKAGTRTASVSLVINMFSFIIFYAFASTLWVSYNVSYWYIFYQLALTSVTIAIPYLLSKITTDNHINFNKMITTFSVLLSFVFLIYYFRMIPGGDGRLGGLLGGAAIIPCIMIPVFAVHLHNLLHRKYFILSFISLFTTMAAIFLTSSRAGLLSLILFVLLTIFRRFSLKRFIAVMFSSSIFVYFILQFASTDHYRDGFEDTYRTININTGISWAMHSISSFIFGNGYGSIWEWYAYQQGVLLNWTYPLMETQYGFVLFHPHSVFIGLFAELGLVGTVPFFVIIYVLVKEFWKSNKAKNEIRATILGALVSTLPLMHTDLLFFRNWEVSIIWLFYLFTSLTYKNVATVGADK